MKTPKTLDNIYLYRMTHVDNIPHILKFGITGIHSPNANPNYKPIGDATLINYRSDKEITTVNDETLTLGDFIPFYFGVRMPMLYVIQHGGNFVPQASSPAEIIYLVVPVLSVLHGDSFFTDGHAIDLITQAFNTSHANALPEIIDWEAVDSTWWSGEGIDTDIKRGKQAEFLVKEDIPVSNIEEYICSCAQTRDRLVSYGIESNKIIIRPQSYYH